MKQVLFVASEAAPFAKTGGLGDVVGSLPVEMTKQGIDARVIMPWYRDIPQALKVKAQALTECTVNISWRKQEAVLWKIEHNGVVFYFVDQPYYFDRSGFYGYFDDAERFAFFSQAVLALLDKIDFVPDIIHAHDWHTAMIPLYLEHFYRSYEPWKGIKTVFTIHNLAYQGKFSPAIIEDVLGLNWGYFTGDKLEFNGCVNLMKAGILYASAVTTVSETYAEEIMTPEHGEGLDGVLRACSGKFYGLLNGIDYGAYNPWKDPHLVSNFHSAPNMLARRQKNKEWLWDELGFAGDKSAPIVAVVSRIVASKGFDLICEVISPILDSGSKLVILGAGEAGYEGYLRHVGGQNAGSMAVRTQFNEALARQIYGGSDIFLMPSVFEPCGIGQMVAMRYGCIPVVHETGGLIDTVRPYNKFTGEGTGFGFREMTADSFLRVYNEALEVYGDRKTWLKLVSRAMKENFSWNHSVKKYIELYDKICEGA
jgi:starch synthase